MSQGSCGAGGRAPGGGRAGTPERCERNAPRSRRTASEGRGVWEETSDLSSGNDPRPQGMYGPGRVSHRSGSFTRPQRPSSGDLNISPTLLQAPWMKRDTPGGTPAPREPPACERHSMASTGRQGAFGGLGGFQSATPPTHTSPPNYLCG
ncbi:hypothetical protein NDU88_006424 [Pleurodeles waltl]|uniref:Uncharacterized protein n=1 Tax=Pleurodeles waltl TaxID=8319 RepID=A0AAV7L5C2_PLEWA|nr:hypothetical protein NDU88_006424 [Pleurodeles waltl]